MRYFIRAILLSGFMLLPQFALAQVDEEALQKAIPALENHIKTMMKAQGLPGCAVAIVSKDRVYYLRGFGLRKIGQPEPVTPYTLFQIASLSKPINATLAAILQEQGKLSLEDPVHKYLPEFKGSNRHEPLKICHLISHSSGVPNGGFSHQIENFTPREQIIARLQKARAICAPGKQFNYNNAMYGMVGDVITSASGKRLDATLREELFTPLGMHQACVGFEPMLKAPNKAYPHVPNYRGRYVPADKYSQAYYAFPAAGGVNASAQDLVPFVQLYLGKPSPIISREALRELTQPYVQNTRPVISFLAKKGVISNNFYGLGWNTMTFGDKKVIYHQGHVKGFRNFMGFIDNEVGIIILTNAERKHSSLIAISFFDHYLKDNPVVMAKKQSAPKWEAPPRSAKKTKTTVAKVAKKTKVKAKAKSKTTTVKAKPKAKTTTAKATTKVKVKAKTSAKAKKAKPSLQAKQRGKKTKIAKKVVKRVAA